MSTHIVTKRLPKGEESLEPGTLVDASDWRNTTLLEEQRYIKPIQPDGRDKRMGRKDRDGDSGN